MNRQPRLVRPAAPRSRGAIVVAVLLLAQLLAVAPAAAASAPPAATSVAALPGTSTVVPSTAAAAAFGDGTANEPSAAPAAPGEPAAATGDVLPSVHYEDARAHAGDRIDFEPGGRVDVPFRPRANDRFEVGGGAPRALPAGRATGREMAASEQGSRWTTIGGTVAPAPSPVQPAPSPVTPEPSAPAPGAVSPSPSDGPTRTPAPTPVSTPSAPAEPAPSVPVDAPAVDPTDVQSAESAAVFSPAGEAPIAPAAAGLQREVFGFLPYWELSSSSTSLNYDVLSTIAYFSVGTDRNGNLLKRNSDGTTTTGWSGWTSSRLTNVINAAHSKGTRVVLTITSFAWTESQKATQGALLGSPTARLNLARQAAAAVRDRGADGINLDFEPIATGYGDEFGLFVREVRAELNRIAPGYQLTFDTTGFIGNYPIEAATAPGGADAIFIMGYDYRTAGSSPVGSIDPLAGPTYDITDTVKAFTARVPASKIILGVPYYGRAWSTDTDLPHAANISGTKFGASTTVNYVNVLPYATQHGRRWDATDQSPYVVYRRENCTTTYGCVTSWRQIWYDDATSLKKRYDLVNTYGLRGAGIWALGYDDARTELNAALAEKFGRDATPPVVGIKMLATKQRDAGFLVTWLGTDTSGIAGWDVQVSVDGGAWVGWLTNTTKTSDVYLGDDGHGYAFRVRARDTKGNESAWNVTSTWSATPALAVGGFATVNIDGLAMRSSASISGTKLGELTRAQVLSVVGGPVSADGYTWWRVTGPLREWRPVTAVTTFWVAQGPSTAPYLLRYRAPNSTTVDAVLADLDVGDAISAASVGDGRAFSPNGDGRRDTMTMRWTNSVALDTLTLRVFRADGTLVGSRALEQRAAGAQRFDWDGFVDGVAVADGTYLLALVGVAAGVTYSAPSSQPVTPAQVAAYGVTVDTVAPVAAGSTAPPAVFSPNGDGIKDVASATLKATGGTAWGATVAAAGTPTGTLRATGGSGTAATWAWDGRTSDGSSVADGAYRLSLWVGDAAGNRLTRTFGVSVDTRPGSATSSATPATFSPNGDRYLDSTSLRWSVDEPVSGVVRITRGATVLRTWAAGTTGAVTWNGLDRTGAAVPDGAYSFQVDVVDAVGNRTVRNITVRVDRTAGALAWSPGIFFPQDGDALSSSSTVSFKLTRAATTTLRIYTHDGAYVRTAWLNRSLPAGTHRWTWTGRDGTGAFVPRGWYRAVLTTTSWAGTSTTARNVLVDAYSVTATPSSPTGGQTLNVSIRSAESLAGAPQVTFAQSGLPAVTKTATAASGGRWVVAFAVAPGAPGPATLTVNGRDSGGRTNRSVVRLTVG